MIIVEELNIYASTPFKFIIGGNAYYIHAGLVSHHSRPLDRMINGSFAEAQKGFAVLEDVDEDTFARFIEWAYKGCYTAAKSYLETSSSPLPAEPSKEQCEPTEYIPEAPAHVFFREPSRANLSANENYTEVFLSHARLYVFAEKYDIQLLAELATKNLHNALDLYTLHPERSRDIVDLLRYVYANTSESLYFDISIASWSQDRLRTALKYYMCGETMTLMSSKEFRELIIEDGGPLLDDFLEMVWKRFDWLESERNDTINNGI